MLDEETTEIMNSVIQKILNKYTFKNQQEAEQRSSQEEHLIDESALMKELHDVLKIPRETDNINKKTGFNATQMIFKL